MNALLIPLHHVSFDLSFCFNRRKVAALRTDGIFHSSSDSADPPTLAFLDLEAVGSRRDMSVRISSCNRVNLPVDNLRWKHQQRLRPTKEIEDPYIAAVLIALAQQRRCTQSAGAKANGAIPEVHVEYISPTGPPPIPPRLPGDIEIGQQAVTDAKVHVLALPATDERSLYFYTALIPSAFLNRLDRPSQWFSSSPVLISYYRIPLKPREKMIRAVNRALSAVRNKTP